MTTKKNKSKTPKIEPRYRAVVTYELHLGEDESYPSEWGSKADADRMVLVGRSIHPGAVVTVEKQTQPAPVEPAEDRPDGNG